MLHVIVGCRVDTVVPGVADASRFGEFERVFRIDIQKQGHHTVTTMDGR